MLNLKNPEIAFALESVRQACLLARQVQAEMVSPALTKADRSPVTVADFSSQAVVAHALAKSFPHDPLVAEEDSASLREPGSEEILQSVTRFVSGSLGNMNESQVCEWIDRGRAQPESRFWTLDPIDGTKGFLRGDQYVVALALIEQTQVQIGVLGCPNLAGGRGESAGKPGALVIAVRGQGTWRAALEKPEEFSRLQVSDRATPASARLMRSFESGHTNVDQIDLFKEALKVEVPPVSMDSQAKYALLAAGEGDLLLRLLSADKPGYREKIWDQAAGSLVLEEAGGRITDLDGKNLDFSTGRSLLHNRGILASNGLLHTPALEALRQIGA